MITLDVVPDAYNYFWMLLLISNQTKFKTVPQINILFYREKSFSLKTFCKSLQSINRKIRVSFVWIFSRYSITTLQSTHYTLNTANPVSFPNAINVTNPFCVTKIVWSRSKIGRKRKKEQGPRLCLQRNKYTTCVCMFHVVYCIW